jgi:hypothetical protein
LKHDGEWCGFIRALAPDADLAGDLLHEVSLLIRTPALRVALTARNLADVCRS